MAEKELEKKAKIKNEFLIFKIEANPKINNSYKFLGAANSLEKAHEIIQSLNATETGRIAILEKKEYYDRKPAITLNKLDENIITE